MRADWIWLDALSFEWDGSGANNGFTHSAIHIPFASKFDNISNIIISGCAIGVSGSEYVWGILCLYAVSNWCVVDNTMIGSFAVGIGNGPWQSTGEGVQLLGGSGHIVAYNSITRFADAISIDKAVNSDVYTNQIWDCADNGLEPDDSYENVRMWGNRITFLPTHGLSFQPQRDGPWYFMYNQIGDCDFGLFKFNVLDRCVFINNTFAGGAAAAQSFMRCYMRNNLFSSGGSPVWGSIDNSDISPNFVRPPQFAADWNTDIDYDAFDRGGSGVFFNWYDNTVTYSTIASWTAAVTSSGTVGISAEENGIEITTAIYDDWASRGPTYDLILAPGGNAAFETGQVVNNLADFHGGTPDRGAHQRGDAARHYGPRNTSVELDQRTNHWTKH
jgi:hypothetical protein